MKLICYLSNGYPDLAATEKTARQYVNAGCDIIEIDLPAKDPYLESPFIRKRMTHALGQCDEYENYLTTIEKIVQEHPHISIIILVYEQTVQTIGVERFVSFCHANGLKDIIYVGTDFPWLREALIKQGLNIASYIRFHLPKEDVDVAKQTNGFIYLQAKPGETNDKYPSLETCIRYLREQTGIKRPIYCGVGISTPDDVRMVKQAKADGVFVGSAILRLQNDPDMMADMIRQLKKQTV